MSDASSLIAGYIESYRTRLLDLTKRNNLISFKFTARNPQFIRIIDTVPDKIFVNLTEGKKVSFRALPDLEEDEPPESGETVTSPKIKRVFQPELPHGNADAKNGLLPLSAPAASADAAAIIANAAKTEKPRKTKLTNAEIARYFGINPDFDLPEATADKAERGSPFLQTLLKTAEMERSLSKLDSYIRTDEEEKGVNTLYAAFFFLEHYEAENSETPLYSPLLLMPLKLEKTRIPAGYEFHIEATGDETEINPSLMELLKRNFGINLPDFDSEDETAENFAGYMAEIAKIIRTAKTSLPQKSKWRLRRFLTIGRFHFDRLTMYQDLENEYWPEDKALVNNPILEDLMAKSGSSNDAGYAEDYDIDAMEAEHKAPLLITSADASQHSAIADVMADKNLAIQGPPGTGKSQTIANIIANALAEGKKVLFLAEKMAALNVVYSRLSHAKLGDFCLELHSAKARKTEILKSIKQRLDIHAVPDDERALAAAEEEFNAQAAFIRHYTDRLNMPFGKTGKTAYEYLWALKLENDRLGKAAEAAARLCAPEFSQADIDENNLNRIKASLRELAELKKAVDAETANSIHPWSFISSLLPDSFARDELKLALQNWHKAIGDLLATHETLLEKLKIIPSLRNIAKFITDSSAARQYDIARLDEPQLARIKTFEETENLAELAQNSIDYTELCNKAPILTKNRPTDAQTAELAQACRQAQDCGADKFTAAQLSNEIADLQQNLQILSEGAILIHHIENVLKIAEELKLEQISALLAVPAYAAAIPAQYLQYRQPAIMDAANAGALQKAAEAQTDAEKLSATLPENYDLAALGSRDIIMAQADLLDKAGMFAFFSSAYRRAKKAYIAASKNSAAFNAVQAAVQLRQMAHLKEQRKELDSNKSLAVICGSFFCGAETDFPALWRINLWAQEIRKTYSGFDDFSRKIREYLFKVDAESVNILRELASENLLKTLLSVIAKVKEARSRSISYKELIADEQRKLAMLEHLQTLLQSVNGNAELNFCALQAELDAYQQAQILAKTAARNTGAEFILGDAFKGINTDLAALTPIIEFSRLCAAVPPLKELLPVLFKQSFHAQWAGFLRDIDALERDCQNLRQIAEVPAAETNFSAYGAAEWENLPLPLLQAILAEALSKAPALNGWADYHNALNKLSDIAAPLAQAYISGNLDFQTLPTAFQYMIYYVLGKEIYRLYPELQKKGLKLESARTAIQNLGDKLFTLNRAKIFAELSQARPLEGISSGSVKTWTEAALLHKETIKKKRHIPIRDLMRRAGRSIQAIKPCFLMSPFTVAQYLTPGEPEFDLLVIDEASQMRPEEALGGIARAKQIVVVGDPKQLPPTAFFQSGNDADEEEEYSGDEENIMQLALTAYRPPRILSRHYRSKHESLIAFSNSEFYDNKLILFPSPQFEDGMGLTSQYIGGPYQAGRNMAEVKAISRAALQFMRDHPGDSLGIATMNVQQRDLIEEEMDKLFTEYEYAEDYRLEWKNTLEPFFIKNLENVQGDERDAIFISTVYGPDANGNVMQRFGPINQSGGERRLNVLFSRAKKIMKVFTSLHPDDIKISETSSKGLRAFRGFLDYAQTGRLDAGKETYREPDSDFEIWVKEKLESIGCEAVPQVGVGGYRIDLGVKHPDWPYGYLLGVECDGRTYHSSKSARERDIIRQNILEGLGWHIYRIWSSDWFADPDGEFTKLKQHINGLLADLPTAPAAGSTANAAQPRSK